MNNHSKSYRLKENLYRSLALVTAGGCLCMIFITALNSPVQVEFFRVIGADDFHFGILGAIPMFGLAVQLVGAFWGYFLRRRKGIFLFCLIASRVVFLIIAATPYFLSEESREYVIWIFLIIIGISSFLNNIATPLWFSWMADLIPKHFLAGYWGMKQLWCQVTWTVSYIVVMLYIHFTALPVIEAYSYLVVIGVIAGVLDILLFIWVDEPPSSLVNEKPRFWKELIGPFKNPIYRSFLKALAIIDVAIVSASVFIQVFLLKCLKISLEGAVFLSCVAGLGNAIASRFWGKLADRYGCRPILTICLAFKPIVIGVILFVPSSIAFEVLLITFFIDGIWNAGLGVSESGYMMRVAPKSKRAMYVAVTMCVGGVVNGLAATVCGVFLKLTSDVCIDFIGLEWNNYRFLFAASVFGRIIAALISRNIQEPKSTKARVVLLDIWGLVPQKFFRIPIHLLHYSKKKKKDSSL